MIGRGFIFEPNISPTTAGIDKELSLPLSMPAVVGEIFGSKMKVF